jgi:hypothetical protein
MLQVVNTIYAGEDTNDQNKRFKLNGVYEFEVNNNNTDIPSVGYITISRKDLVIDNDQIKYGSKVIKLYDQIAIKSTYTYNNKLLSDAFIFNGYLTDYSVDNSFIKLSIESTSFVLKKMKRQNFSLKNPKLSDILMRAFEPYSPTKYSSYIELSATVIGDYKQNFKVYFTEMALGGTWLTKDFKNPMEVLSILKDELKIFVFEYGGNIYVNQRYPLESLEYKYAFPYKKGYNYIIDQKLDFKSNDIENYIVKAKSAKNATETVKFAYGYDFKSKGYNYIEYSSDRDKMQEINLPAGCPESTVKMIIQSNWGKILSNNIKTGSFLTFGFPVIRIGDKLTINLLENEASYLVDGVVFKSSTNGIRQDILLGQKLS